MKKLTSTLLVVLGASIMAYSQNINTVAGNFAYGGGYSGDGGQATAAELAFPTGVVFDNAGNMYISDQSNNVIRQVNKITGKISTYAGMYPGGNFSGDGGQATAAELNDPMGVAIDSSGNIYIADNVNSVIRKVTTAGIISTVAGIAGQLSYSGDGGQATAAELYRPTGTALDKNGDIYIADCLNTVIRKVDKSTGKISTVVGIPSISGYTGDGGQATAAELMYPQNLTLDSKGDMYIADAGNNVIRYVDATSGKISTIAGNGTSSYNGDGGPATAAEMNYPTDVRLDAMKNMYICDQSNNVVRLVTVSSGIITTVIGDNVQGFYGDGGPATAAELYQPLSGGFDKSNNFYVVDESNNVIRGVTGISTGEEQVQVISTVLALNIFPNPASTNVSLVYNLPNSETKATLYLYDSFGRLIRTENIGSHSGKLNEDVSSLSNGIYFYSIRSESGAKTTSKLLLTR